MKPWVNFYLWGKYYMKQYKTNEKLLEYLEYKNVVIKNKKSLWKNQKDILVNLFINIILKFLIIIVLQMFFLKKYMFYIFDIIQTLKERFINEIFNLCKELSKKKNIKQ